VPTTEHRPVEEVRGPVCVSRVCVRACVWVCSYTENEPTSFPTALGVDV
jgi:hypothetical protein